MDQLRSNGLTLNGNLIPVTLSIGYKFILNQLALYLPWKGAEASANAPSGFFFARLTSISATIKFGTQHNHEMPQTSANNSAASRPDAVRYPTSGSRSIP
jgi:hypothetical protein